MFHKNVLALPFQGLVVSIIMCTQEIMGLKNESLLQPRGSLSTKYEEACLGIISSQGTVNMYKK